MNEDDELLNRFNSILNEEFPSIYYSLNGYSEEAVCIEKQEDAWEVYIGFRNQKKENQIYYDLESACVRVIDLLSPDRPELREELIKRLFEHRGL